MLFGKIPTAIQLYYINFIGDNINLQILKNLLFFSQVAIFLLVILIFSYDCLNYLDGQNLVRFFIEYFEFNRERDRLLLGDFWFLVHQESLQLIQPMIERYIAIWLWDPIFLFVLQLPLAVVSAFIFLVIYLIYLFTKFVSF